MCLKGYLSLHHMTPKQFAAWLDINPQTVWAWLRGRKPRAEQIERIFQKTGGEIRPDDWFTCSGHGQ